jgi:O-antigen ligase
MNISKIVYKLSLTQPRFEFSFILIWTLFFPSRDTYLYFLTSGAFISLMLIRRLWQAKNVNLSVFSLILLAFNLIFLISIFFSSYQMKSILFFSDILLVSLYFIFLDLAAEEHGMYLKGLAYCLSLFSLIHVLLHMLPIAAPKSLFLESPIHQGIASGIGVLIFFYYLIEKITLPSVILLLVNTMGVYVSASKAAFLGIAVCCLYMVVIKRKKWLPFVVLAVILTFIIPNPIRHMFHYSLKKDPYVLNRLDIWKMSIEIFKDHPLAGVGLDNFSTVSPKYNFKQEKGPAHYFKAPRMPHSDYFKILTETGIPGLLVLLAALFFILKKSFSASLFDIKKILTLYLLFQALFMNVLFFVFFFFLFVFLMKALFEKDPTAKSIGLSYKWILSALIASILLVLYLFPYLSQRFMERSRQSDSTAAAAGLLAKAEFLNPLNHEIFYLQARLHLKYFREQSNLDAFYYGIKRARKAQRLNPYDVKAYLAEADLYLLVLSKKLKYAALEQEILAPLEKAEWADPKNPFIQLKKAHLYLEFSHPRLAESAARHALEIEPDYAAALYFLHDHFHYIPDREEFQKRIDKIRKKSRQYQPTPGTYLYELFKIPTNNPTSPPQQ